MSTLIKESHGIIYDENFQTQSLIWSLSPSDVDCLRFENDGLHILHNNKYITYTMKEYDQPYCLLACIEHEPLTDDDIAGVIVFCNTRNYAECQTYLSDAPSNLENDGKNIRLNHDFSDEYVKYTFDDDDSEDGSEESDPSSSSSEEETEEPAVEENGEYKYIKVVKFNSESKGAFSYQFYSSIDGLRWIEVGNAIFPNPSSIGFFLYSTKNKSLIRNGKFVINSMHIYKNPYIIINGINAMQEFEIYEEPIEYDDSSNPYIGHKLLLRSDMSPWTDIINRYNNKVEINTTQLLLPFNNAKIRIYPKDSYDVTLKEYLLENYTFGGDIFTINNDIRIFVDNVQIQAGETYDLGMLFVDSFKKNIVIYNNEEFDLYNLKVSIQAYSEYFHGEDVVKMALYQGEMMDVNPNGYEYSDNIIINTLEAHNGAEIVLKLSDIPKRKFYSVADKYRFKIIIE